MERREIITAHFPGSPPRMNAIQSMYEEYAARYADSPNMPANAVTAYRQVLEASTAIRFALYVLDHPEEFGAALKEAEESERAWKEHQAKQPAKAEPSP